MSDFIVATMILILGLISPGPDFFLVSNTSMNKGKKAGVIISLGMGLGIACVVVCILFFKEFIDSNFGFVSQLFSVFGFLYLSFLSFQMISVACNSNKIKSETIKDVNINTTNLFSLGVLNATTNPKAGFFLLSILSVAIHNETTVWVKLFYSLEIVTLTVLWFVLVAFFFSSNPLRQFYIKYSSTINFVFGIIIGVFAIKILTTLF